jgi:tuftelin-interacting protein 11
MSISSVDSLSSSEEEEHSLRRSRRRRRQEHAIYGVFGSDEDHAQEPPRRRQAKPMEFVEGSAASSSAPPQHLSEKMGVELDVTAPDTSGRFRELLGGAVQGSTSMRSNADFKEIAQPPPPPSDRESEPRVTMKAAPVDRGFGSWEKHTKGIGSKLLAKMGFKGRLGRNESGVTRQLEVKVRPQGIGLGFGNFQEATTLRVNRELEADRQGKTLEEMGGGEVAEGKRKPETPFRGRWRKESGNLKRKRQYVMAQDVQREVEEKNAGGLDGRNLTIIDMRAPEIRVLASAAEAEWEPADMKLKEPRLGDELLHNVSLIVGISEADLRSFAACITAERARSDSLEKESAEIAAKLHEVGDSLRRMEGMRAFLARVADKVSQDISIKGKDVAQAFLALKANFPEEFSKFSLAGLAVTLYAPLMKRELRGWSPLTEPLRAQEILEGMGEGHMGALGSVLLPPVRRALTNEWSVWDADPEPALKLVSSLVPVEPSLPEHIILPKLSAAIATWDASKGDMHPQILPWVPVLGSKIAPLFPDIRRRLSSLGPRLGPEQVKPWLPIFDQRSMEALITSAVIPELVHVLRDVLVIDPSAQDVEPLRRVLAWEPVVPQLHFYSLLEGEFFPKWLAALRHWLCSGEADLAEVAKWYQGWKGLLGEREDLRLQANFSMALQLMQAALNGTELPSDGLGAAEGGYLRALEGRVAEEHVRKINQQPPARQPQLQKQSVSFKEIVAGFAEEHGLEFRPKPGRTFNGFQVYSFGSIPIYLDGVVVHASAGNRGTGWAPVSFDHLLRLATTSKTKNS